VLFLIIFLVQFYLVFPHISQTYSDC